MTNITNLFTRQPYEGVESEKPKATLIEQVEIDEFAVKILEETLELAKIGQVRGVAIVAGFLDNEGVLSKMRQSFTQPCINHLPLFLGSLENVKFDMQLLVDDMSVDD